MTDTDHFQNSLLSELRSKDRSLLINENHNRIHAWVKALTCCWLKQRDASCFILEGKMSVGTVVKDEGMKDLDHLFQIQCLKNKCECSLRGTVMEC